MRQAIEQVKASYDFSEHPYFRQLETGEFGRENFVETQIQFLHAVVFFSRPMSTLAARIPRPEDRYPVLENVLDEHGHGDYGKSHERTFLDLLDHFGVSLEDIDRRALWPEVRAFNTTLMGVCSQDDPLAGAAALGMIEDIFAGLSTRLAEVIVERGWLSSDEVVHYNTHSELDEDHAEDFYQIVEPHWDEDPQNAYAIGQGLELGAYIFHRLYEDLWRARTRRRFREVSGPHRRSGGWSLPDA
jgi:pyrroloquinoline-quinone synthase